MRPIAIVEALVRIGTQGIYIELYTLSLKHPFQDKLGGVY